MSPTYIVFRYSPPSAPPIDVPEGTAPPDPVPDSAPAIPLFVSAMATDADTPEDAINAVGGNFLSQTQSGDSVHVVALDDTDAFNVNIETTVSKSG